MAYCKKQIYQGEALATKEKITNGASAATNLIYYNLKFDIFFYVNSKGFLHVYTAEGRGWICDRLLTTQNILKETALFKADSVFKKSLESAIAI